VERHHSRVNLVSEVGVGTTFWFDLTLFEEEAPKNMAEIVGEEATLPTV
jgi:two-component system sensor histidine kinase NblS